MDTALCIGYEVSLHYEPLLAKVMVWGPNRAAAIAALDTALADFTIEGVTTNIPLLRDVLASPEFTSGKYNTGSLADILDRRQQSRRAAMNGHSSGVSTNGHHNGPDPGLAQNPRALAAAIGAAVLAAQAGQQDPAGASAPGSRWRMQGRRELFRSRLGSATS